MATILFPNLKFGLHGREKDHSGIPEQPLDLIWSYFLMPGKLETVQFTTYAKEAYYFDDDNFVCNSQIRPPWQGEGPIRDSRTAFGFDLELL